MTFPHTASKDPLGEALRMKGEKPSNDFHERRVLTQLAGILRVSFVCLFALFSPKKILEGVI